MEPAIAPGLGRGLWVLVVAAIHGKGPVGADQHFANRANRHLAVILIDKPHIDAWAYGAAGAGLGGIGFGHDRRRDLGHVENRIDINAKALMEWARHLGQGHHKRRAHLVIAVGRAGRVLDQEGGHHAQKED